MFENRDRSDIAKSQLFSPAKKQEKTGEKIAVCDGARKRWRLPVRKGTGTLEFGAREAVGSLEVIRRLFGGDFIVNECAKDCTEEGPS